nr:MAG TPA: hypothetical protein [Caudoviricetes sp.]
MFFTAYHEHNNLNIGPQQKRKEREGNALLNLVHTSGDSREQ